MREIFVDKKTGEVLKEGDVYKRAKFADTLEEIANCELECFYNGDLAKKISGEIIEAKGIITQQDLSNYEYVLEIIILSYFI